MRLKILTLICFYCLSFLGAMSPEEKAENISIIIIDHLKSMADDASIDSNDLALFAEALREKPPRLICPIPEERSDLSMQLYSNFRCFNSILESTKEIPLDYAYILENAERIIEEKRENEEKRERACEKTESLYREMDFVAIPKGTYSSKFLDEDFEIAKEIEMQETPITQYQFAEIMGYNPSLNLYGDLFDEEMNMTPNRPVDNVSFKEIEAFIAKLNEQDEIYNYSLPSLEKYLAVLQSSFGKNWPEIKAELMLGACFGKNGTCSVRNQPLKLNKKFIYDIVGNVREFTRDTTENEEKLLFSLGYFYSGKLSTSELSSFTRPAHEFSKGSDFGFRLIRHKKSRVISNKIHELSWREETIEKDEHYIWLNEPRHCDLSWMIKNKTLLSKETQHTIECLLDFAEEHTSNQDPITFLLQLEELELHWNQITDVTPLASLTNLKELALNGNQITDVTPLASLTNLEWLDLSYNQITDVIPLSSLTNLKMLYLYNNQITDVTPLTSLTNLETLWLSNNRITDVAPLASLTNLEQLDLGYNQITDITPLAYLTNLKGLRLLGNQITDYSPLDILKKMDT